MNKFLFLLILLCLTIKSFSQDWIVRTNGQKYYCEITKEDSTTVFFTMFRNEQKLSTFLARTDIKTIQYGKRNGHTIYRDSTNTIFPEKSCVTIGILNGGGSLVGFDFETIIGERFGIQGGAGLIGFGAGLNFHLKPGIRTSFLSVQYWHQGTGPYFTQSLVGPSYVYRGKRWFTAQIGLGFALEKGPGFPEGKEQPPVMLTYSIGGYIPF